MPCLFDDFNVNDGCFVAVNDKLHVVLIVSHAVRSAIVLICRSRILRDTFFDFFTRVFVFHGGEFCIVNVKAVGVAVR